MTEPAASSPAPDRRRLIVLCVTALLLSSCLGTYLLGPMLPGHLGRLQAATWEAWGWSGPATLELRAVPPRAWISVRGAALPSGLEGQGLVRARVTPGVYHCTVRCEGFTTQSFEIRCGPDAVVERRIALEPVR